MPQAEDLMPLPIYDHPPIVETVVGVQFRAIAGFTNAHLGAFWQLLGQADWPSVTDMPTLPRQAERFTPDAPWGRHINLHLTQDPASRLQIRNRDGNRMVQLQNDRLHLNWLGQGGDSYHSYSIVRDEFKKCLSQLTDFVQTSGFGAFTPDQWEVTYVNHIPKGEVWQTPADWGFFKPLNGVPSINGLIDAESFTGQWHFIIPEQKGRLHIEWQHGKQPDPEQTEFVRLTLTARGPIEEGTEPVESILVGIDLGHETIVNAFRGLMSEAANKEWKLKDDTET